MPRLPYASRRALLRALPDKLFSRTVARVARWHVPRPLRAPIYRGYAAVTGADVDEAAHPLSAYATGDAFFTRALQPGSRPVSDAATWVSPSDGVVAAVGEVRTGELVQAKGMTYDVGALLADDPVRWEGARYVTIYLSPANYHRVHAPRDLAIDQITHISGALRPVNAWSVAAVPNLFTENERVVFRGDAGSLVMVGATGVSAISVAGGPPLSRRHVRDHVETHQFAPARHYERGAELGTFHLGSTVILMWHGPRPTVEVGQRVQMGAPLTGEVVASAARLPADDPSGKRS